jgi:sterol desaturase/sphingolipid hydroxylase (fatty acid hydroxylase superfamily)
VLFTSSVFWILGSTFSYFDLVAAPHFLQKYKIQTGVNEPVDRDKFLNLMKTVLMNSLVTSPMYAYLHYRAMLWRGFPDIHILPEFHVVLMDLIIFLLIEEIGFFYTHWLFHHKSVRELIFAVHPVLNKN